MAKENLTHKQQIANNRTIAADMLAQRKKEEKRRKIAMWSTLSLFTVALGTVVTLVIVSGLQNKLAVSETSPTTLSSNGIILTSQTEVVKGAGYNLETEKGVESKTLLPDSKVPHIELYLDYDCPHCKTFETQNNEFLNSLLEEGKATVEYKPIVVIGSNLSISGGNAAACVAEYAPARFNELNTKLFEQNGKQSVSVSGVVKTLDIQGEAGKQVESCVSDKVFSKWLSKASEAALERTESTGAKMVTGTPAIVIDGVKYPYAPDQFETFVTAMISEGLTAEEAVKQADSAQTTP